MVEPGASFHVTPQKEWFYEYKRYYGGDVFLGDESTSKIIGLGKLKLNLMDGRIRTFPGIMYIPILARNLIFVRKMDDAGVKTIFEKETYRMVRQAMC
jgi:hypothetical protein